MTELAAAGVRTEFSSTETPEQNGRAERVIQTLTNMVRCMLTKSRLPKSLWHEALATATYLVNRNPHSSLPNSQTPFEALTGKKPDLCRLRVWGCTAFVLKTTAAGRKKLDTKALEGVFVGYSTVSKAWRVLIPSTGRVVESPHVTFHEQHFRGTHLPEEYKEAAMAETVRCDVSSPGVVPHSGATTSVSTEIAMPEPAPDIPEPHQDVPA
jgi:hypothetical protein